MHRIEETYRRRLGLLVEEYGGQARLAEAAGKSPVQINQWLRAAPDMHGRPRVMSRNSARQIEQALGKPAGWMDQPIDAPNSQWDALPDTPASQWDTLPMGDEPDTDVYIEIRRVKLRLSAGILGFAVEYLDDSDAAPLWFRRAWLARRGWNPAKLLALNVGGLSMYPGLKPGDTVLVNTAGTTPKDGKVFAVNYEGEAVIKRLVRDAGQWWLSSDNPDQATYPRKLCDEHCILIGEVVHKQSEEI